MESSILSEVDDTSILRTGLPTPLCLSSQLATGLSPRAPRSGLERSDFVLCPKAVIQCRMAAATLVRLADSLMNLKGGNVAAGHGFACEACNSCHVVEMIGPAFQDIANEHARRRTSGVGYPVDDLLTVNN